MANTYLLEVATPERLVFSEEVESLVAPGTEGQFGILANHIPFVSALKPGILIYRKPAESSQNMAVTRGFLEVSQNRVLVLVDAANRKEEIDVERAMRARQRAHERLKASTAEVDRDRAREALERALFRLHVADAE